MSCAYRWEPAGAVSGFITPLDIRLADPSAHDDTGLWVTLSELKYQSDLMMHEMCVPAGFETDLASVPRKLPIAWGLFGGRGMRAAVLHDWLCRYNAIPRDMADLVFREALVSDGMPVARAQAMYAAVAAYSLLSASTGTPHNPTYQDEA